MTQFDEEMWREFVIEAEENLKELEPNLLTLEQEPGNTPLLNDCFRHMHSIKGAAGYMGLKGITALAHSMENLLDRMRQSVISLDGHAMNVILAGMDGLKELVREVAEDRGETTDVSGLIEDLQSILGEKPVPAHRKDSGPAVETGADQDSTPDARKASSEEDPELLSIFAEEMRNLHGQMEEFTRGDSVNAQALVNVLKDMERVTHYIGIDSLLEKIRSETARFAAMAPAEDIPVQTVRALTETLEGILEPFTGCLDEASGESGDSAFESPEDDHELYGIFLDFVREMGPPLARVPAEPDETWLSSAQEAIERIKNSAYYMDYTGIVSLMDEWAERLAEALTRKGKGEDFDPAPLQRLWVTLQERLPGLGEPQGSGAGGRETDHGTEQSASGTVPSILELESALDELFEGVGPGSGTDSPASETEKSAPPKSPSDTAGKDTGPVPPPQQKPTKTPQQVSQTVRIDLERVEKILGDVGELVVLRSGLNQVAGELRTLYRSWIEDRSLGARKLKPFKDLMIRLGDQTTALGRIVHQLQDGVMRIRMLPVSHLFNRYPRVVRDLSNKLEKKVDLVIEGAETSLDKRVIEQMADPLLHIIRNAIDHGIEPPELRTKTGKPAGGRLTLSASQEGNFVIIRIIDDGRGLDREALLQRGVAAGLIGRDEAPSLSDEKVWHLIFAPGVTTTRSVSETSGRGVGMDIVKKNVEQLGGTIRVHSTPAQGTEITVRIPLTLAIIHALLVRIGRQTLAVPLTTVQESLRVEREQISSVEGFEIISLRQKTIPLIRLGRIFRGTGAERDPKRLFVVVVRHGSLEAGLGVDVLMGQQEVVIKPLAEYLIDQPGFSGATVLGDGSLALILDIPAVVEKAKDFIARRQQVLERAALGLDEFNGMIH